MFSQPQIDNVLEEYNSKANQKTLVQFAKYFANSRDPSAVVLDAVDVDGCSVSYTEAGNTLRKEVGITLNLGHH